MVKKNGDVFVFWHYHPLPLLPSLHIKNSISHNVLLFHLISSQTEKDNPQSPCSVFGRKLFGRLRVVCVYISIVDLFTKSFWWVLVSFFWWSHTLCFYFISSFCCYCFRRELTLFFWTFWDKLVVHPVCTWTYKYVHTNCQCRKKPKTFEKKRNKTSCICSDFVLFFSRQKILTLNEVDKE